MASTAVEQPPLPGVETRRRLRADDLFSLTFVGDVAISPDGNTICFVQTRMDRQENEYRSDLWIVPAQGMPGEAVQYTHVPRTVAQPRWAPNGRWLAFLTDRESKGKRQLWIIPTAGVGGEARQLTAGETSVSDYAWAPDSTRLVFVRPETIDRRQDRAAGDTGDTGEAAAADAGAADAAEGAQSPSGRVAEDVVTITRIKNKADGVGFVNDRRSHLWTVDLEGQESRLTEGDHDNTAPAWSPDCASLDFSVGLGVGSDSRAGLSGGRPVWAPDCSALYVVASRRGDTPLWRVPLDGEPVCLIDGGQQVQSFSLCASGATLALNLADNLNPGDVYSAAADGGGLRRLSDANGAFLGQVELVEPETFTFAGAEGWEIQGWLMKPTGWREGTTYPLILEIHGGPHAAYGNTFFFEFQLLAAQGWGVLYTNPRGSTTYGERFPMASNDDWGGNDYRDLMAGVDAALARATWIDPARLGVTGGSYGGHNTNWVRTQTHPLQA